MITLNLACEIIPGYDLLSLSDRTAFENTCAGDILAVAVGRIEAYDNSWHLESRANVVRRAQTACLSQIAENEDYIALIQTIGINTAKIHQLAGIHYRYLKNTCENAKNPISILNLENFNQTHAQDLAKNLVNGEVLSIDHWIPLYEQALINFIQTHLGLINNINPLDAKFMLSKEMTKSVSYLSYCELFDRAEKILDGIADAHGVIQATGFSTQNESSSLSWLDLYNYKRSAKYIQEAKKTLNKFFQPFAPLLAEFYDITNHENNIARQIVRTLTPFLILATVVILVAAPLSQIVVPEVASIIILIPTVYIGLLLATAYVAVKNSIYHAARYIWYGSYGTPEFIVNKRMELGFQAKDKAELVQEFYVDAIKDCSKQRSTYDLLLDQGLLSASEQNKRKENQARLDRLKVEWIDIHSNTLLGHDLTPQIVLNRMRLDIQQECAVIREELPKQRNEIEALVRETVVDLRANIDNKGYVPQFFKPDCFKNKERAEKLNGYISRIEY